MLTHQAAKATAEKKDGEEESDGLDVYLALINGVVGRNKELKYDNGALQYFFGVPPKGADAKARDVMSIQSQQSGELHLMLLRVWGAVTLVGLRGTE